MTDLPGTAAGDWWWCLKHSRAESDPDTKGDQRLGPYPDRAAAENWRERVDARNEKWEDEDARWDGREPRG